MPLPRRCRRPPLAAAPAGQVRVAVAGAHLRGQPLHPALRDRRAVRSRLSHRAALSLRGPDGPQPAAARSGSRGDGARRRRRRDLRPAAGRLWRAGGVRGSAAGHRHRRAGGRRGGQGLSVRVVGRGPGPRHHRFRRLGGLPRLPGQARRMRRHGRPNFPDPFYNCERKASCNSLSLPGSLLWSVLRR